ncbi:LysR family transcriptional regulator [Kocuria sp. CPCC 205258]|uniref:LysR family transcriptional regulator n=1 Tax=Kocuria sp. CPCC 205258 TaxID=3073552 RepID=UPI0034D4C0DE
MLNLKHLQVLHELARHGTLTKTAAALHFTPSAVSQQLAALQRVTGVELLEHVGRGVRLSPAAEQLVEHARAVFDRLALAESDLAAFHGGPRGRVRVASFHTVLLEIAPLALTRLSGLYPDLEVQLINQDVDEGHTGLLSHDFDLVLGEDYPGSAIPDQPGVHREDFYTDPIRLVVPAQGLKGGRVDTGELGSLSDLKDAPWAMEPPGTRIHRWTVSRCREAGFEPRVLAETPDPLLNLQLVRHGHAVAAVPALLGEPHLAGVVALDLPELPCRTLYTEVRTGRERHPALVAVREAFRNAIESINRPEARRTLVG